MAAIPTDRTDSEHLYGQNFPRNPTIGSQDLGSCLSLGVLPHGPWLYAQQACCIGNVGKAHGRAPRLTSRRSRKSTLGNLSTLPTLGEGTGKMVLLGSI